jgi:hypothetical protein
MTSVDGRGVILMSFSGLAIFTQRGRLRWCWSSLLVAVWAGSMTGCSSSQALPVLTVYEVKGKVLLADGKPLADGWIYFVAKGDLTVTPSGRIGPDGTFSIVTGGSGEGAPAGDYKIRVESPQYQATQKAKKPLYPFKYTDEDSSGIVIKVKREANQLEPLVLK